jgi:dephospho-CoA kinase
MSKWHGKFVIGLTGNIAAGKSVVRKMLENLGAYGIDADALSRRATAKGAPGYQPVIDAFGDYLAGKDGEIDRSKLGELVFSDAAALEKLESILHPLVRQAVDHLVTRASQRVVVIEAIKLLESPLREACDSIWVVTVPEAVQVARLEANRGMDEATARRRMAAQSSQKEKAAAADVVIENNGSFGDTWERVSEAWARLPAEDRGKERDSEPVQIAKTKMADAQSLAVLRARPKQAQLIAEFISARSGGKRKPTETDIMADFGEKAYLMLWGDGRILGLVGWKVENLVARTDEAYFDPQVPLAEAIPFLVTKVEDASRELQCEASLIFISPEIAKAVDVWSSLGYEPRTPDDLGVSVWQAAANESKSDGSVMLFKQLRVDRVLRPI